ncbi:unnamed protein product [Trichogramma brassicae]|uniref:Uncharacterized protein n=1 Tax=Trichogramma brassicae TaxID=86971 RepID=A0A6H5I1S8_9HYME|nr:unnamed protein product [Trichogramma brassicae]
MYRYTWRARCELGIHIQIHKHTRTAQHKVCESKMNFRTLHHERAASSSGERNAEPMSEQLALYSAKLDSLGHSDISWNDQNIVEM